MLARPLTVTLGAGQAVALYELVASSPSSNGLGTVYAELGALVRDGDGRVPGSTEYEGPWWAGEGE